MKLTATLIAKDKGDLFKALKPEIKQLNTKRSKIVCLQKKDNVEFNIECEDSTAMRATLNGITKLITVYEKVDKNV